MDLARQGQRDQRAGRSEAAQAKLRQACEDAEREQLSGPLRAQIHLIYAWSLLAAGDSAGAQREGERAAELDPKDAEVQRDLAELQRENGQHEAAAASAQRALDLGLSGRDADEMRVLAGRTEPSGFRARFRAEAGSRSASTQTPRRMKTARPSLASGPAALARTRARAFRACGSFALREDPVVGADVYRRAVAADYATAQPAQNQAAMPFEIALGARYRVLGSAQTGLSVGYQFRQLFMVVAQGQTTTCCPAPSRITCSVTP